jgi:hypothetical protein
MSKNVVQPERPQITSQYGAYTLHARLARLHAPTLMYTPARPVHARTRTHKYVIFIAFPRQQWFTNAPHCYVLCTRWFKYDRDDLCVNKSQSVPVIFEPPCTSLDLFLFPLCHSSSSNAKTRAVRCASQQCINTSMYFAQTAINCRVKACVRPAGIFLLFGRKSPAAMSAG